MKFRILAFAAGALLGSAVTWKIVKTKYEQIAREEIDSVKEAFKRRAEEDKQEEKEEPEKPMKQESVLLRNIYRDVILDNGYSESEEKEEGKNAPVVSHCRVIRPEEFGEADGFGLMELNYFADGILADDWGTVFDDVDDMVGLDSLERFGEYEEDSVYVRNYDREMDYQILLNLHRFADVFSPSGTD